MGNLTSKEEAFCQAIARLGEKEKVSAYKEAGYSVNMSNASVQVQADKLFNKPKLALRIKELRSKVVEAAEKRFTISIERRLRWLEDIVEAGLSNYVDGNGQARRENLAAAKGAIETLNTMLGIGGDEKEAQSMTITFGVKKPVGDIKITKGEQC